MVASSKTKKHSLSLGGLRKALEHIKASAQHLSVPEFQKEYKKTFHKNLSPKQAKEYMQSLKVHGSQKGGAAPLAYDLLPGAAGNGVSVPPYLAGGFGFANVNSTIGAAAGVTDFGSPGAEMGSNKVGGGSRKRKSKGRVTRRRRNQKGGSVLGGTMSNVAELFNRPFPAQGGMPSMGQDAQMLAHGAPGFNSPRPELHSHSFPQMSVVHSMQASAASKIV